LTEYDTDFIFPTVGEQFGLVGCATAMILLLIMVWRMIYLASVTQDMYGVLIITGLTTMLCTHIFENVGMTIGLMPVSGVPLPFFSYGGSFMLTCMISVGLVLSIGARRGL
jgi:rod shape determining protein RodA